MIPIKSPKEIKIMREGGKRLAFILYQISAATKDGMATIELDVLAEKLIKKSKVEPSFKYYKTADEKKPFPTTICVSLNDEVVHGIPSREKILKNSDIVSIDLGVKYKGLHTDMAVTFSIGNVEEIKKKLIETTQDALEMGIDVIKNNAFVGDIGFAIQSYVEDRGLNVVKKLVGHGIGYNVHEEPEIPNFGVPKTGVRLKEGMVLALEPMVTQGSSEVILDKDGWTWKTKDGSLAAHFEHTVVVTKSGAKILTKI